MCMIILSVLCMAKRWCVWCNLQINVKRLIIFKVSFCFVALALLSRFGSISTCYMKCNVLCTRCIPVSPFRLIMLWISSHLAFEPMIEWDRVQNVIIKSLALFHCKHCTNFNNGLFDMKQYKEIIYLLFIWLSQIGLNWLRKCFLFNHSLK